MRMQIFVRLKTGVLDVQGKAVEHGLEHLGLNASDVRVGKLIELDVDASSKNEAETKLKEMCEKLLVNTVIESYEIREAA
ncbi:MAG: phosphoribosylformylglycinamidine synthase subunit PurS [Bdellovibrionales bacterium]|nr:phosphoribosylformylglycinamidine synthase subunit PurS [Bdellovibrionales bacterium]